MSIILVLAFFVGHIKEAKMNYNVVAIFLCIILIFLLIIPLGILNQDPSPFIKTVNVSYVLYGGFVAGMLLSVLIHIMTTE
jgi:hypothetical protein